MKDFLQKLKQKVVVAVVGGSDLVKIKEQMGGESCMFCEYSDLLSFSDSFSDLLEHYLLN